MTKTNKMGNFLKEVKKTIGKVNNSLDKYNIEAPTRRMAEIKKLKDEIEICEWKAKLKKAKEHHEPKDDILNFKI